MEDELTVRFRKKVDTINPLNKRALSRDIGVDYDRMNKWLTGGINIRDEEDRTLVDNWLQGISKKKLPPKIDQEIAANPYFKEVLDMLFAEKDNRIKDLEASVRRLSVQVSEKNNIINKLKEVETNLTALLKKKPTPVSKGAAS
jgi:hypothetical protein